MAKTYAVDANVVIRYLTRDDERLWKKADTLIRAMDKGRIELLCDPVTLAEIVFVLGSFYKLTREQVCEIMEPIVACKGFTIPDKDQYVRALELYGNSVSHFGDACACAAAIEHCEGRLLSFDKKLSGVEDVQRFEDL